MKCARSGENVLQKTEQKKTHKKWSAERNLTGPSLQLHDVFCFLFSLKFHGASWLIKKKTNPKQFPRNKPISPLQYRYTEFREILQNRILENTTIYRISENATIYRIQGVVSSAPCTSGDIFLPFFFFIFVVFFLLLFIRVLQFSCLHHSRLTKLVSWNKSIFLKTWVGFFYEMIIFNFFYVFGVLTLTQERLHLDDCR